MKRFVFLTLIVLINLYQTNALFPPEVEDAIDEHTRNVFMANANIPGFGFSVVQNGTVQMSKGYGLRDIENGHPVNNNTKFLLASIAKTFAATIVVKVLSEKYPDMGAAALDMPIAELFPAANLTLPDRYRSEQTSFRDMLSHRHCLRGDTLALGGQAYKTMAENAYRARYSTKFCPFRSAGIYNNQMFTVAGEIIAQIAGSTYEELLGDLLTQIGMMDSTWTKEFEDYESMPDMTKAYYLKDRKYEKMNSQLFNRLFVSLPPSGVISTSGDMTKYMLFHLNKGKVGDTQVVSAEAMSWLQTLSVGIPFQSQKVNPGDSVNGMTGVGLAFTFNMHDGWYYYGHGGSWPSFISYMILFPTVDLGIFGVTNGPGELRGDDTIEIWGTKIFDIIQGINRPDKKKDQSNAPPEQNTQSSKTHLPNLNADRIVEPSEIAGLYGNPLEGDLNISYNPENPNGTLYIQYGKWVTGYLRSFTNSTTIFLMDWDSDMVADFYSAIGFIPDVFVEYTLEETINFIFDDEVTPFKRNATLETYPTRPWDPESC